MVELRVNTGLGLDNSEKQEFIQAFEKALKELKLTFIDKVNGYASIVYNFKETYRAYLEQVVYCGLTYLNYYWDLELD